jgi:hypothetical protein
MNGIVIIIGLPSVTESVLKVNSISNEANSVSRARLLDKYGVSQYKLSVYV